jgi:hypothetical protein
MFFLQQNRRTREQGRFCLEAELGRREVPQIMYAHVIKYKNNKTKYFTKGTESLSVL